MAGAYGQEYCNAQGTGLRDGDATVAMPVALGHPAMITFCLWATVSERVFASLLSNCQNLYRWYHSMKNRVLGRGRHHAFLLAGPSWACARQYRKTPLAWCAATMRQSLDWDAQKTGLALSPLRRAFGP